MFCSFSVTQALFKENLSFQFCVYVLFLPVCLVPLWFSLSVSIFLLPPLTSVGLFAGNNPFNSRVIGKQHLSGGAS